VWVDADREKIITAYHSQDLPNSDLIILNLYGSEKSNVGIVNALIGWSIDEI